jgi:hypothetical protein
MIKKILILILLAPSVCFGAISEVSIVGGSFTISGSDFGSNSEGEWLGDNIEDGVEGEPFTKTSWNNYYNNKATYSDTDKHSGSKSILFDFYDNVYARALVFDYGATEVTESYMTAWVKIQKNDDAHTFQWKNWKIKDTPGYDFQTTIYGENWHYDTTGWGNTSVMVMRNTITDQSSKRTVVKDGFLLNEWQRLEAYYKKSSALGVNDGVFEWRRVGRASGEVIVSNYNIITHDSTNENQLYRYIFLGHYYGNLLNSDSSPYAGIRDAEIYYDDIYISRSRSRIEIGNHAVFANCTHREIQPAITWSDTGITGTFNQGSFNNGDTVYFFVVDEDGIPSDGYPVTIGGDPSIANPIVEILTESGQTTAASVFIITGTATADTGQTISGVTCSGQTVTPNDGTWDEQVESFTCLANLSLGENVLIFIGSDGTRTGSDSITITRTIPGEYTTRGAGFSIKGCTLK